MADENTFGAALAESDVYSAGFTPEMLRAAPVVEGPAGPDAGIIGRKAGGVLARLRIVKATFSDQVVYPNLSVPADRDLVLGLTLASALIAAPLKIRSSGIISDEAWAWELGPVWCGPSGQLVQSPPDDGWTLRVGTAISPTTLLISIDREGTAGDPIDPGDLAQYFLDALTE